ncbi:MAG: alpha/beta fold hydrolase [Acidimicrobiales bacterium]
MSVIDRPDRTVVHRRVGRERLRVTITGEGQPLLLIMGLGGNLEMWGPLEQELVPLGFQTIAFDAPGTGGSDPPAGLRRMAGLADLTAELLDGLGYDQVDALGVSFGGAVAQELAHRHPTRVGRLVLAATTCGLGSWPGDPWATALLLSPVGSFSRARSSRLQRPPTVVGYWSLIYAATGWTSWPWLHRLTQPTLVLAGDADALVPLANGRQLAAAIPDARLEVIDGGDHLFLLHDAVESAKAVAGFLTTPV